LNVKVKKRVYNEDKRFTLVPSCTIVRVRKAINLNYTGNQSDFHLSANADGESIERELTKNSKKAWNT